MKKEKMTLSIFNKLSQNEQNEYIENLKKLYIDELRNRTEVADILDISIGFIKYLLKTYHISKTKEQLKATSERTCLLKYGVKSTNQLESVKKKQSETCQSHYGVSSPLKLSAIRNKLAIEQGCENVFQLQDVKDKIKQTNLERYGVEHVSQRKDVKNKVAITNLERYGSPCAMSSKPIQEKIRKNNLEKYGVEWCSQREDIKEHLKETCLKKYGVPYFCMTENCRSMSGNNSKVNQYFENLFTKFNIKFAREFGLDVFSYDFKIDNILLEVNPSYTHNSTKGVIFKNSSKSQNSGLPIDYHISKLRLARENGFRCIHVWDWDDIYKVINLLLPKQKLYARKLELREISKKECDEFLNLYHLQNTCRGQIVRYGLYKDNQLIQIMTFGKPRYNKNYEWELLRLCTHKDYKVVGGSERLWKHFLREQNPKNVISYCDNSKFSGEVYERLGMKLESFGGPSCNWSKGKQRITQNLLNQQGVDRLIGTNDGKGTSNRDIMIREGWAEVYDCGQSTYIL